MNFLESFVNRTTMYRLVLYGLSLIAAAGFVLTAFGVFSWSISSMALSLGLLLLSCWIANAFFSRIYGTTTSVESIWITALILFLILAPPSSVGDALLIFITGLIAIISKFVLSLDRKHIFNPAAIALVIMSFAGSGLASWWVGSKFLLPIVAFVGYLIVRKIHRFDVLWSFVGAAFGVTILFVVLGMPLGSALTSLVISGPLVFFATIMLTEPLTMPPTRGLRIVYGLIVGGLYASQFHSGIISMSPHLALVAGNLYSYAVSSKQRLIMRLRSIERLSANVYEFVFRPNQRLAFAAGQYLEWTLPHARPDAGGNRRYLTIASSPTEPDIRIGVRIDKHPSSFKRALLSMKGNSTMVATSLSGDFTLPKNPKRKLLFIAGGVGITPFTSMLRYLHATKKRRDIVLIYAASREEDLAYRELVEEASREIGLRVIYLVGQRMNAEAVRKYIPDVAERQAFISGPDAMVASYQELLTDAGVSVRDIKTDYFTGFSSL